MSLKNFVDIHHRNVVIGNKLQFYCSSRHFTGNVSGWYGHKGSTFVILQSLCLNPGNPTGLTALSPDPILPLHESGFDKLRKQELAEQSQGSRGNPRFECLKVYSSMNVRTSKS